MLILGSKSPRRKEILEMAKIPFKVELLDVEEDISKTDAKDYVLATALKKGLAYSNKFKSDTILCADTVVEAGGEILEKPVSKDDARIMIEKISGKSHLVHTGVFIGNSKDYDNFVVTTKVYVRKMTLEEIEDYINTSEPYDKAGAYAIQGIFGKYIEKIDGDYYNVMGLPLCEVNKHLDKYF